MKTFKQLRQELIENIDEASPVVAAMMRAKARISPSYKMAKKELKDKVKKDPSKAKISHAAMVAKKYSGVDARTLHDVTEQGKGLYYNINKKRKEGRAMRKKGAPGAPKPSDFDRAKQTASEEKKLDEISVDTLKSYRAKKYSRGDHYTVKGQNLLNKVTKKIRKKEGGKPLSVTKIPTKQRTPFTMEDAPTIGGVKMKKLGKSKPGGYKSLVSRHLGASAAEKIDKSDGAKLVAKGKKTGNTDLVRKGNFIKNIISKK